MISVPSLLHIFEPDMAIVFLYKNEISRPLKRILN